MAKNNAKKRKLASSEDTEANKRQRKLETFFKPQVTVRPFGKHDKNNGTRKLVALNEEQIRVRQMVVDEGKNVFFTGAAGRFYSIRSGKSLLLRAIIVALKAKYSKNPSVISITASTGMAASNIGGMTIHSWGAINPALGAHNIDKQVGRIKKCKPALKRWIDTKVLIIDEGESTSMVDGHVFDVLAKIADQLRNKKTTRPFGGIQLVITGDFFQLPPVTRLGEEAYFAFESAAWKRCIDHVVTLKQVYRQKDAQFVDLLNELRLGIVSPSARQIFTSLSRPLPPLPSGILPTELFPLRAQVEEANVKRLASLPGKVSVYQARNTGPHQKALDQLVVPSRLALKVNAQVMLVKNFDEKLVNGTVGRILGFHTIATCLGSAGQPLPAENNGESSNSSARPAKAKLTAAAATAQAASGSSSPTSATGSTHVKGPVRNVQVGPDGRTPISICGEASGTAKENAGLAAEMPGDPISSVTKSKSTDKELYPLVEFWTQHGTEIILVVREEFRLEDNEGTVLARRIQVPLVLAWATSIHKSQGQTLQHVKVDLRGVFEKGQSYVALSRAASLEGLQVLGFDPNKVKAHPKVVQWRATLEVPAPGP